MPSGVPRGILKVMATESDAPADKGTGSVQVTLGEVPVQLHAPPLESRIEITCSTVGMVRLRVRPAVVGVVLVFDTETVTTSCGSPVRKVDVLFEKLSDAVGVPLAPMGVSKENWLGLLL